MAHAAVMSPFRACRSLMEPRRSLDAASGLICHWREIHRRDTSLLSQVRFVSGRKKNPSPEKNLSRSENRKLTRELKRKEKNGLETPAGPEPKKSWTGRFRPRPRFPGGSSHFQRDHLVAAGKRFPLWLILAILVTSDDTSPLRLDRALGPSMLPTIHPLGDLYLRDTGAWQRALNIQKEYSVGDVVAIRNPSGQGYSCKRIVGLEGDEVLRYGQFADWYKDREDFGIVTPRRVDTYNLAWDDDNGNGCSDKDISQTLIVPPSHVWVEGDNPLFSVDSRHYGPLPMESIRGRLLMRVWPLWRVDGVRPSPVIMTRKRPVPLTREETTAVGYNLYRKSVPIQEKI